MQIMGNVANIMQEAFNTSGFVICPAAFPPSALKDSLAATTR